MRHTKDSAQKLSEPFLVSRSYQIGHTKTVRGHVRSIYEAHTPRIRMKRIRMKRIFPPTIFFLEIRYVFVFVLLCVARIVFCVDSP